MQHEAQRQQRRRELAGAAAVGTLAGLAAGAALFTLRPAEAQGGAAGSTADVAARLSRIERRLARIESAVTAGGSGDGRVRTGQLAAGRWLKVRDDGQHVVLFDTQTGRTRFLNTASGKVIER